MRVRQPASTLHVLDIVLPQQHPDARGESPDHAAAAVDRLAEVVLEVVDGEAELLGPVEQAEHLRVLEQRLAGNAAPVEADAAELRLLHQRRPQAELARAYGRHVASGAAADYRHVEVIVRHESHPFRLHLSLCCPSLGLKSLVVGLTPDHQSGVIGLYRPVHLASKALNFIECCTIAYVYAIFVSLAMPVPELNVAGEGFLIGRVSGPQYGKRRIHFFPQSPVGGRIIGAFMDLQQKALYVFMKDRAWIRFKVIVSLSSICLILSNAKNDDDSVSNKAFQAFGHKDDDGSYFDFRGFRVS